MGLIYNFRGDLYQCYVTLCEVGGNKNAIFALHNICMTPRQLVVSSVLPVRRACCLGVKGNDSTTSRKATTASNRAPGRRFISTLRENVAAKYL